MFEHIKENAEKQVIDELVLFAITVSNVFKNMPIKQDDLVRQSTQLGTITKEQVVLSLKRLIDSDSIKLGINGYEIKTRTKIVEKVFKDVKESIKQRSDAKVDSVNLRAHLLTFCPCQLSAHLGRLLSTGTIGSLRNEKLTINTVSKNNWNLSIGLFDHRNFRTVPCKGI